MECDICGQEVQNSEDLQRHRERLHPYPDEGVRMEDDGEKPDFMTPKSEPEAPEPAQQRR